MIIYLSQDPDDKEIGYSNVLTRDATFWLKWLIWPSPALTAVIQCLCSVHPECGLCLHLGHLSGQFPLLWFQSVVYKWPHHYLRIASHLVACFNLLNTQTCLKWSIEEVQYFFDILLNCTSTVIFQKMSDWFLALAVDLEIIWKVSLEVVKPVCDKTPQKIRQIPSFFLVKYIFRGKGW